MPENLSPTSSRATWPLRDLRTKNTVTKLVTATHHQARLPPWRQLVSSRCATACSCTYVRASSSIACCVVRLDKRYAPVYSATVACTRGPYVLLGTPAGQGARVTSPHAEHHN